MKLKILTYWFIITTSLSITLWLNEPLVFFVTAGFAAVVRKGSDKERGSTRLSTVIRLMMLVFVLALIVWFILIGSSLVERPSWALSRMWVYIAVALLFVLQLCQDIYLFAR